MAFREIDDNLSGKLFGTTSLRQSRTSADLGGTPRVDQRCPARPDYLHLARRTGELRYEINGPPETQSEEDHSGLIQNSTRSATLLNDSSAESRRSRRLLPSLNVISTHPSG